MKIGYARVSTDEQKLGLQLDALEAAGCDQVFRDEGISGADSRRPGLDAALAALSPGDVLVVWRLDRLGRSLAHLLEVVTGLGARGVEFASLSEAIDTRSAGGRLVFHMMAALAEFERALISERTRAGLVAARRRGAKIGRPPSLTDAQIMLARKLVAGGRSRSSVARDFGVAPSTVWRAVKEG